MLTKFHGGLAALFLMTAASGAQAAVLVDGATTGFYNDGIATVLNGTDAFFVTPTGGDPTVTLGSGEEPDLSAAAAVLGDWLVNPAAPSGSGWSATKVAIPGTWTVESETAIIYEIDGGATGLTGVNASIGVDNGILVWLNGTFIGGEQRAGGAPTGEYSFDLGDLGAGKNYLQLLREDHGGATGFNITVTGETTTPVPLPAAGVLLVAGLGGLASLRRRT